MVFCMLVKLCLQSIHDVLEDYSVAVVADSYDIHELFFFVFDRLRLLPSSSTMTLHLLTQQQPMSLWQQIIEISSSYISNNWFVIGMCLIE